MGIVADMLLAKTPKVRAAIKSSEYAKLPTPIRWVTDDKIDITIERLSFDSKKEILVVDLVAVKDGKEFDRGTPYYYHNPPIMVPTGRKIDTGDKSPDGKSILTHETIEDLPAALMVIVERTVRSRVE